MPKAPSAALPADLLAALDRLSSREGEAREEALAEVVRGAGSLGRKDRQGLGDALVALLGDGDAHTRSFAAVPLAYLASELTWRRSWTEPFLTWWTGEPDQRGYDATVGWVHAVAHGADVVGELGLTSAVPAEQLLDAVARRLTNPAGTVWRDQEEDRLALAVAQVLLQDDLTEKVATRWIKDLTPRMTTATTPIPAATINTCRTLRSLYVLVDGRVPAPRPRSVKHAGAVQQQIRALLEVVEPWTAPGP
ncbi:DUF2785 domain-containing protein [Arsenicicoccus sp. oral taxon 190]|uniref:DUF2785 domain-containing protein n=1 Tax=Arsenicicoccus sp. oral taxon 190 TaxID=1658671 RepID=UPI00067B2F92|nr:DUF2785 domain-containing protein [Arsenicicoccus sp. oral taxon 190]